MTLLIEKVRYRIGDFTILDGVSGAATAGEVIGIVGPNGAGKSTLANVVCGILRPTSGRVVLDGKDLSSLDPPGIARLGISRLFQGQHLAWNLSVEDNLLAAAESLSQPSWRSDVARLFGLAPSDTVFRNRIASLMERLGLFGMRRVPARDLSFGQQRLLALGRALLVEPKVLVLDEPFTGLKDETAESVLQILKDEQARRVVLVIDHVLGFVRSVASRIWYLNRGRLTEFSNFSELERSPLFATTYLGRTSYASLESTPHDRLGTPPDPDVLESGLDAGAAEGLAPLGARRRNAPLLSVSRLSAGYGTARILEEISFDLGPGEVLCIVGRNGSGKSTLLRAILGAVPECSGLVQMDAMPLEGLAPDVRVRLGLRLLPQDRRVFRSLSVEDNIVLACTGLSTAAASGRGLPLKRFESAGGDRGTCAVPSQPPISLPAKRLAGLLSGGEQTQLALHLLSCGRPRVVLMDEPTAGLDGAGRAALVRFIHDGRRRGIGFLVVEHDLEFLISLATDIAVLRDGQLNRLDMPVQRRAELLPGILTGLTGSTAPIGKEEGGNHVR